MAGEEIILNESLINPSDIASELVKSLPPEIFDKISLTLRLSKIALIIFIVYFVIAILRRLFQMIRERKNSRNLSKITGYVEKMSENLEKIVEKREKKSKK